MAGIKVEGDLTQRQRAFAERLAAGDSQADAYRSAYDATAMKPATVRQRAWELAGRKDVRDMVERMVVQRRVAVSAQSMSERDRVTALLRGMALDEDRPDATRLRAAELWGRAVGAFLPDDGGTVKNRPTDAVIEELQRRLSMLAEHDASVVSVQADGGGQARSGQDDSATAAGGEGLDEPGVGSD